MPENTEPTPSQKARLRGLTAAFMVVFAIGLVVLLTVTAYLVFTTSQIAEKNSDDLDRNQQTNALLVDCNTPGGDCYQQTQDLTSAAVLGVNQGTMRVIVAALACQADGFDTRVALARCTVKRSHNVTAPSAR